MSGEILDSTFWEHIYKLDVLLREAERNDKLETSFSENRDGFWNFARSKLGIYGGAFGLAHRSRREFFLLQNPRHSRLIKGIPYIQIPYITPDSKDRDLIDLFFIGRRTSHDLLSYPPEFYYHLPSNRISLEPNALRVPLPVEDDLSQRKGLKFLHCTVGEIYFFLYAWRWLVRYVQVKGGAAHIEPDGEMALQPQHDLWSRELWQDDSEPIESEWLATLKSARGELATETEEKKQFRANALAAWERLVDRVDVSHDDVESCLETDWKRIGLFDRQGIPMRGVEELMRFGLFALRKTNEEFNSRIDQHSRSTDDLIVEAEKETRKVRLLRSRRKQYAPAERAKLHRLLRRMVCSILKARITQERTPTGFNCLNFLHEIARFPIIPYFYLAALDGRPKEHLVFPVWESKEFSMPVKGFKTPCSDVVFCLLTLRPLSEIEEQNGRAERKTRTTELSDRSSDKIQRFYQIFTFFSRIAQPIIDKGFYGSLVMPDVEQKRQQESGRAFGHEIKHVSSAMTRQWVRDISDLFDIELRTPIKLSSSEKLGSIQVWHEPLVRELGIVPFKTVVRTAGNLINLWCLLDNPADIPANESELANITHERFRTDQGTHDNRRQKEIEEFVNVCWKRAIEAVSVHAIRREVPSNRERIIKIREILEDIQTIYEPVVTKGDFPLIDSKEVDTIWLARVLIALLTNCAQHGDPTKPVEIILKATDRPHFFELEARNLYRRSKQRVLNDILKKGLSSSRAKDALDCIDQASGGMSSLEPERFGSKEVVRLCLQRLDGKINAWPELNNMERGKLYSVRMEFRYLGGGR